MNILSILPLAFEQSYDAISSLLNGVHKGGGSQAVATSALALATFIVGVKLIKMAYNMFSDEQQGGFGGIRLSQVLRPILIILAINASPTIFKYMNITVSYITTHVGISDGTSAFLAKQRAAQKQLFDQLNLSKELTAELNDFDVNKASDEANKKAFATYEEMTKGFTDEVYEDKKQKWIDTETKRLTDQEIQNLVEKGHFEIISNDPEYQTNIAAIEKKYQDAMTAADDSWSVFRGLKRWNAEREKKWADKAAYDLAAKRNSKNIQVYDVLVQNKIQIGLGEAAQQASSDLFGDGNGDARKFYKMITDRTWWQDLIFWIYDVIAFCVKTFARIGMTLMAMFFPWVLCLSLLDHFKNGIWQFFSGYLTLAMYSVVCSAITGLIGNFQQSIAMVTTYSILPSYQALASKISAIGTSMSVQAMIYIAGAICLTKVGSIVKLIIPNAADTGDFAGGGAAVATGAMSKGAAAAKKVAGGGVSLATGTTGIQSAKRAKSSQKSTQAFQQNVTNALGRMSGGGSFGGDDGR